MTQYDLFGGLPPHVKDSETSKEAAVSIAETAGSLRETVRCEIIYHRGATCDEVEAALDLRHQTASARIRELFLQGKIYDSGQKRKTRSGRSAVVWFTK